MFLIRLIMESCLLNHQLSRLARPYSDVLIFIAAFINFRRSFSPSAVLPDEDLPYHIVVGMPALSPTMETGNLSEWYVEEGSGFSAGESIAKIETDKASIDFEAQDDGYVGKKLLIVFLVPML